MENASHESYPIAMQNLCDAMARAGHTDTDDIITTWEMKDRFLFIREDGEGSGFFMLSEFYKDAGEFGGGDIEYGSLSECWAALEQLQEEGRTTRETKVVLQVEIPNEGWQTLVDNANQELQDLFNTQETDRDGAITKHGMRYRLVTVSK